MTVILWISILGLYALVYWIGFKHGLTVNEISSDIQAQRIEILERDLEYERNKDK